MPNPAIDLHKSQTYLPHIFINLLPTDLPKTPTYRYLPHGLQYLMPTLYFSGPISYSEAVFRIHIKCIRVRPEFLNPDPDSSYFLTLPLISIKLQYFIIIRFSRQKKSIKRYSVLKIENYFVMI